MSDPYIMPLTKNSVKLFIRISLIVLAAVIILNLSLFLLLQVMPDSPNTFVHMSVSSVATAILMVPLFYLLIVRPIRRDLVSLENLSIIDHLTGLTNRRGFNILAEQQLKYAIRAKENLELFFVDLDNLKLINDTFGHRIGDEAIQAAAAVLKKTFRGSDIVARLGGDEFAILTLGKSSGTAVILSRIASLTEEVTLKYKLSMSIGVTVFDPDHPCTLADLVHQADAAMYVEKKKKKQVSSN
ncbi:MAG: GGDEF domain-containing protein [candidate division WWE3 bacterium]|nr:GGDEF domain-containing protein [candidate division WWE3 bacterium]